MNDNRTAPQPSSPALQRGLGLFTASEALLKGVLEAEMPIELIAGPALGPFEPVFSSIADETVAGLLAAHGTRLSPTPDAGRAVALAHQAALSGRRALVLLPNDELDPALSVLERAAAAPLADGAAMGVVLEDDPPRSPASCPRSAAVRLDLPCVEPPTLRELRDAVEHSIRLSRAGKRPVAVVVHHTILRSVDTLEARPNRVRDAGDAVLARAERRALRGTETAGVLRLARRLELNRTYSGPTPGEKVPCGFLAVGPTSAALAHIVHVMSLYGRVPLLQLGLLNPIDGPLVERLLGRCEKVVLLEPRPGSMAAAVMAIAEDMRRRGEDPADLWSRLLPPDTAGRQETLRPEDAVHPSILARKIAHLLHLIRPSLDVADMLVPDPPALPVRLPRRGADLGMSGARALVRSVLADVDQWLRDQGGPEQGPAGALAIDGVEPQGAAGGRVVRVETWSDRGFLREGVASLRQAAYAGGPWIFVLCVFRPYGTQDLERLVRGAVPGEQADRVRIEAADLNDRAGFRSLLQEMAVADLLGVIVAGDGPPSRFDVTALERARAEIDRLGYERRQRAIWPAEEACAFRRQAEPAARVEPGAFPSRSQVTVTRRSSRLEGRLRLRVRPLLEEVEVVRDRPPAPTWRQASRERPPRPEPIHGRQAQWRAHMAGLRGEPPGVAAWALFHAGRTMGYQVSGVVDPTPIGPGRRAWAQVLFTRPGREEDPVPLAAGVPYGEADLLLGLDGAEALRAIDREGSLRVANFDRTCAVVNLGAFEDERDREPVATPPQIHAALRAVTRGEHLVVEDFAGACRGAFQTDRVADLALLGAAFQLGLVPVTREAIEASVQKVEARGFGRAAEAFQFGCHLAADRRVPSRPQEPDVEEAERAVRRTLLLLRRGARSRRATVARFAELLRGTVAAMPGLGETDPGRTARRELVAALERCLAWGGLGCAVRYADLIVTLYRADRGDMGRGLTRDAILPLAEAMLIRDPFYVAAMATSPGQRRRLRRRLNVKLARGDRLERRFLTRIELVALRRRFRLDLRTSDWPAHVLALVRRGVPAAWRGSSRERRIRAAVIDVVQRAALGAEDDYRRWSETMHRLHTQARDDRLRNMAPSELQMLLA